MSKEYKYKNKDWLIEQINKYKNITDISIGTGYAKTSLIRYIEKYNLKDMLEQKKKIPRINLEKHPYKNKEWLIENLNKYKNIKTLCEKTGCPQTSIRRYIKIFELNNMIEKYVYKRNKKLDEDYFETIDNEHKAYWLGMLVADGNIDDTGNKYCIRLTLKEEDEYLICALKKDLKSEATIYKDKYKRNTIRVWSKKMFNDLLKLGIVPKKTGKEVFPSIPDNLIHHFVRGFFDGDGTIFTRKNRQRHKGTIGFCCQNEKFIQDLIYIINKKCGVLLTYNYHKGNVFESKTESKEKCLNIINFMYKDATIAMLRKYNRTSEYFNYYCPSLEKFKEESRLIDGELLRD